MCCPPSWVCDITSTSAAWLDLMLCCHRNTFPHLPVFFLCPPVSPDIYGILSFLSYFLLLFLSCSISSWFPAVMLMVQSLYIWHLLPERVADQHSATLLEFPLHGRLNGTINIYPRLLLESGKSRYEWSNKAGHPVMSRRNIGCQSEVLLNEAFVSLSTLFMSFSLTPLFPPIVY